VPEMAEELAKKMVKVSGKTAADYAEELAKFVKKTLEEKLDDIKNIWEAKYPILFESRTFFEDIMGEYRYMKSDGWAHTSDISTNFKGVDFYRDYFEIGDVVQVKTAVSMKTTITTDVNKWLNSTPVKDNIRFLEQGLRETGIESNKKIMRITEKAEVHIYMPKENITPQLKEEWLNKLNTINPKIKFEINSVENYIN
jgi:hypothetical protein